VTPPLAARRSVGLQLTKSQSFAQHPPCRNISAPGQCSNATEGDCRWNYAGTGGCYGFGCGNNTASAACAADDGCAWNATQRACGEFECAALPTAAACANHSGWPPCAWDAGAAACARDAFDDPTVREGGGGG
jgi:hypothetical protein